MRRLGIWRRKGITPALLPLLCMVALSGCGAATAAQQVSGGNADRGASAIARYGCGACHIISGISGASGEVGPPLSGVGSREYIAGRLRNTPANMVLWIRFPQSVEPGVAMPDMDVTANDARDIAQYLYTLR
jgi:cytochrome c